MSEVHKLEVVIEASNAKLMQVARTSMQATKRMTSAINSELKKIQSPASMMKDAGLGEASAKIKGFMKQMQLAAGIKVHTDEYKKLTDDVNGAEKELARLEKQMAGLDISKRYVPTQEFKDLEKSIERSQKLIEKLNAQKSKMKNSGKASLVSQEFKDLEQKIRYTQEAIGSLQSVKKEMENKEYERITEQLEKAQKEYDLDRKNGPRKSILASLENNPEGRDYYLKKYERNLQIMKSTIDQLSEAKAKIEKSGGMYEETAEYKRVTNELARENEELREYNNKRKRMIAEGAEHKETKEFRDLTNEISRVEKQLKEYEDQRAQMVANGTNQQESESWQKVTLGIASAKRELESYQTQKNSMEASGTDVRFSGAGVRNLAAKGVSKTFSGMKSVFDKVTSGIKKTGGAFGALIQRFRTGIPMLNRFNSSVGKSNNSLGKGLLNILKYSICIRSLFVLFNRMRSALTSGFTNLAQYSQTTNASLSTLKSGLNQLQNSFAAAFAPVLNVVVPILDTLISYLVAAVNAVGQFFAALTGQGSYTVAKRAAIDFAAGAGAAGDAAGGAADQAERLQRTLMGFDEINKLDDSASGSGGSGGGGGGGGAGAGDLFTTETVTNQFADFAEKVKAAWANADFTEIGSIIGEKLKKGLDNIPWGGIQQTAQKIGKSVATLINGFVETAGLDKSIGNTVAQAINTGVLGANKFLKNLHWESVGSFIAEAINGFISGTNWQGAGEAVKNGVNGVFQLASTWSGKFNFAAAGEAAKTALNSALSTIEWEHAITAASNIGRGIANALNKVIKPQTFRNLGRTVSGAINTVISGAYSFIGTIDWVEWGSAIAESLTAFFDDLDWKEAGLTLYQTARGIVTMLITTLREMPWKNVGRAIANGLKNIPWKELLSDLGNLIWEAINAAIELWKESFKTAPIETAIVTGLMAMKFTGLGSAFGSMLWKKIKTALLGGEAAAAGEAGSGGLVGSVKDKIVSAVTAGATKAAETLGGGGFLGQIFQAAGGVGSPLGALFDNEMRGYMANEWKRFFANMEPYIADGIDSMNAYVKKNPLRILPGYGLLEDGANAAAKWWDSIKPKLNEYESNFKLLTSSWWENLNPGKNVDTVSLFYGDGAETPEIEVEITGNTKKLEGSVDKAADYINETLPNETSMDVDANTDPVRKSINSLEEQPVKGISVGVALATTGKAFSTALQKLVKGTAVKVGVKVNTGKDAMQNSLKQLVSGFKLGIESENVTKPPIFQRTIDSLLSGYRLGVETDVSTNPSVMQSRVNRLTKDFTLGVPAEISTSPAILQYDLQSHLKGYTMQVDATANLKNLNDKLTTAQKTIGTTAKFQRSSDALSDSKKTIKTTAKYTNIIDSLSAEKKRIAATARYVDAIDNLSSSKKILYGLFGYVSNVGKQPGITLILSGITAMISAVLGGGRAGGGMYRNGSWKPITAYASGGTPATGQMFIAREAGPELVGRIGSGTAVMNNNQIVASVSAGVYQAVLAAMEQGESKQVQVNVVLEGEAEGIFKVVKQENDRIVLSTGKPALLT